MKKIILIAPIILFLLASCQKDEVLRGQGPITTQKRNAVLDAEYQTIRVHGATKVNIIASYEKSLELKGYSNLMNDFVTEIRDGVLTIGYKENVSVRNDNIEVTVRYPRVGSVELHGSCEAYYQGEFPLQDYIRATINGSGEIFYEKAYSSNVNFTINGSGNIDGRNLSTLNAEVVINGSGDVKIAVVDRLKANVNGSGTIFYVGNPILETSVSGSGKIIPLN